LNPSKSKSSWLPLYLLLAFVWGASFVLIKSGLEFLSPFGVAFIRCALGAVALFLYAKFRRISFPSDRRTLLHIWVISILLNVVPGIAYSLAETVITSVLAALINAVTPLATVLAILAINREEKPKPLQLFGLLLGFSGVSVVLGAWRGLGDNPLWAILILLVAVSCYGISFPYTRKFIMPLKLQSEAIVATQLIFAAFTLLPIYLIDGISISEYPLVPVISMLVLGIVGSGFAFIWNFRVMLLAGSAVASSITYLMPLVAVVFGIVFLSERITWNEPVGALVVLFGAAIAQERITFRRKPR
jgi:drug/metabolite transporter (DMT)-like permease